MRRGIRTACCKAIASLCLAFTVSACNEAGPESLPVQILVPDNVCDVRSGCIGRYNGQSVSVRMAPHRSALKPFNVSLAGDFRLDAATVSLEMQGMDMGQNRYRLLEANDGSWQTSITLPVCTSGRSDWMAIFELQVAGKRYRMSVPFTLGD